jgi:hypothetical protein
VCAALVNEFTLANKIFEEEEEKKPHYVVKTDYCKALTHLRAYPNKSTYHSN